MFALRRLQTLINGLIGGELFRLTVIGAALGMADTLRGHLYGWVGLGEGYRRNCQTN